MCLVERITMLLRIQMSSSALHPLRLELSVPRFLAGNPSREDLTPETGYAAYMPTTQDIPTAIMVTENFVQINE